MAPSITAAACVLVLALHLAPAPATRLELVSDRHILALAALPGIDAEGPTFAEGPARCAVVVARRCGPRRPPLACGVFRERDLVPPAQSIDDVDGVVRRFAFFACGSEAGGAAEPARSGARGDARGDAAMPVLRPFARSVDERIADFGLGARRFRALDNEDGVVEGEDESRRAFPTDGERFVRFSGGGAIRDEGERGRREAARFQFGFSVEERDRVRDAARVEAGGLGSEATCNDGIRGFIACLETRDSFAEGPRRGERCTCFHRRDLLFPTSPDAIQREWPLDRGTPYSGVARDYEREERTL